MQASRLLHLENRNVCSYLFSDLNWCLIAVDADGDESLGSVTKMVPFVSEDVVLACPLLEHDSHHSEWLSTVYIESDGLICTGVLEGQSELPW